MRPCGVFDKNYAQDIAIVRTWQHWTILIIALIVLYLFPLFGSYYLTSFMNLLAISVIVVLGLQIVSGYCGQISFGQAAFMAIGAYTSSILTIHFGLSFWIALPLSGIMAGAIGIIGGAPSLRIKGMYLAMATIAIHFVVIWLILHLEITGSFKGLYPPYPSLGGFEFDTDERMYYIIMTVMVIMTYAARNLMRTKVGRAFVLHRVFLRGRCRLPLGTPDHRGQHRTVYPSPCPRICGHADNWRYGQHSRRLLRRAVYPHSQ